MPINTRRLRASLPVVDGGRSVRQPSGEKPYVLWLLVFLPVALIFAIHFVSEILTRT